MHPKHLCTGITLVAAGATSLGIAQKDNTVSYHDAVRASQENTVSDSSLHEKPPVETVQADDQREKTSKLNIIGESALLLGIGVLGAGALAKKEKQRRQNGYTKNTFNK